MKKCLKDYLNLLFKSFCCFCLFLPTISYADSAENKNNVEVDNNDSHIVSKHDKKNDYYNSKYEKINLLENQIKQKNKEIEKIKVELNETMNELCKLTQFSDTVVADLLSKIKELQNALNEKDRKLQDQSKYIKLLKEKLKQKDNTIRTLKNRKCEKNQKK